MLRRVLVKKYLDLPLLAQFRGRFRAACFADFVGKVGGDGENQRHDDRDEDDSSENIDPVEAHGIGPFFLRRFRSGPCEPVFPTTYRGPPAPRVSRTVS